MYVWLCVPLSFCMCVPRVCALLTGWALEDWLRSLFSHACSVYELLCVSGPYIITNELVIHNAAERKPLCPAELLELWSLKKWQIVVVKHPFITYHLDENSSRSALFYCLCSLDMAEDEFIQVLHGQWRSERSFSSGCEINGFSEGIFFTPLWSFGPFCEQ